MDSTTNNVVFDIDECVKSYMKNIKPFTALKKDEEHKLLVAYKQNNDLEARNKLITSNLKYTCKLANQYRNRGIPFSHLISEANAALMYAIDKFDETQDVKLMSYAKWWIMRKMDMLIEEKNKMPEDELPTEHDDQLLDDNVDFYQEYGNSSEYENIAFVEDEILEEKNDNNIMISQLLANLSDREVDIIKMRFAIGDYEKEYTLEEIGDKYNLTKERVRQIMEKAFTKMRSYAMMLDVKNINS